MMSITAFVLLAIVPYLLCVTSVTSTPLHHIDLIDQRSPHSYAVEGCYLSFRKDKSKEMKGRNSNVKCQDICRDKGYILAATQGDHCHCGNIYPSGQKTNDSACTTKCREYTPCFNPQSCCGGPSAYSVSVVGNIIVPKQVLRRLIKEWQTNKDYKTDMKALVKSSIPETNVANWEVLFDKKGWETCDTGKYMTGMERNQYKKNDERIGRIESAECRDAPDYLHPAKEDMDCYNHNWWSSFDKQGWSTCNKGYYMTGMYNTGGPKLGNIEEAKCCKPKSQKKDWGTCTNLDAWSSFDKAGWTKCNTGYYMAGLYRSACDRLGCLEMFKCCKMGEYNGNSWIENPIISIKIVDVSGTQKHCSVEAMDKTPTTETYECESIVDQENMMKLNALSFNVEDESPLNVAAPKPIPGFRPVICSAYTSPYTCTKTLGSGIETSSTFTIGTGFDVGVSVSASVELSAEFLGSGVTTTFGAEVSSSASFNTERSDTKTTTTTDTNEVSVDVPINTEVTINLMRTTQDLLYKWKATFELLGKYSLKWKNDQEAHLDVTTVLTGNKRNLYAFGSWNYPGTDVIRVIITDNKGHKVEGCEHNVGEKVSCKLSVTD